MKIAGRIVGATCALLSAGLTWQLMERLDDVAPVLAQLPTALVAFWTTFHRKSHEFLPFVAAVAFFGGLGWYLIMNPPPVRWIGIANLGYLAAWWLLRDSRAAASHC